MLSVGAAGRIEDWFAAGERVPLQTPAGRRHRVFARTLGDAGSPWVTLLHGFPTCSWDWAPVAGELARGRRLLMLDFLGFGDSDKPRPHAYSFHEQADLVEALWRHHGVERTAVVAHDYGVSVGQELLARRADGTLGAEVERIAFLNGGLYPDLHRALPVQRLLRRRLAGALIARVMSERAFARSLARVFSPRHQPAPADLHAHWLGVARRGGHRIPHLLIRYIDDRLEHERRWVGALESTDVPRRFVWGMVDPVSGAHVAERLRERLGAGELHALDDVGHYPQVEAPERVGPLLAEFVRAGLSTGSPGS
jgi:pimeloyl-ACP methyl ester carboxylesterase